VVYVGIVYRKKPHEKITIKRTIFQVKNYHWKIFCTTTT
jgi:hypothetical protein